MLKREKGSFTVFFIDYGNTDVLPASRIKPLDPKLGIVAVPAQASARSPHSPAI